MRMCVIVPTRGRPQNLERLADAFIQTKAEAELFAIIDRDDPKGNDYSTRFYNMLQHNESGGSCKAFYYAVKQLLDDSMFGYFDFFMFMGDDHLPRTINWDKHLIKPLIGKTGISYGNDLIQGATIPTHFCMTRDIARNLNEVGWPDLNHLYFDNFMKHLGEDIGSLNYFDDVIIEHMHASVGKSEMDEGYKRVNRTELYDSDSKILKDYLASAEYAELINRLK